MSELTRPPHHDPWAEHTDRETQGQRPPWCNDVEAAWYQLVLALGTGQQVADPYGGTPMQIKFSHVIKAAAALGRPVRFLFADGTSAEGLVICTSLNTYGPGVVAYDLLDGRTINHADLVGAERVA